MKLPITVTVANATINGLDPMPDGPLRDVSTLALVRANIEESAHYGSIVFWRHAIAPELGALREHVRRCGYRGPFPERALRRAVYQHFRWCERTRTPIAPGDVWRYLLLQGVHLLKRGRLR